MAMLIVVDDPADWPLELVGAELVRARDYLTESRYLDRPGARVFNLCRSYRYQSSGYYVSLLAAARGHKPLPSITTIQDLKTTSLLRLVSEDLDELIQKSLTPLQSRDFTLSIYFGHNLAKRHERLSQHLFRLFPAPFLRSSFVYSSRGGKWLLQGLAPIAASEIPVEHRAFVVETAQDYFRGRRRPVAGRRRGRFDLAILVAPGEPEPPSDAGALRRLMRAASRIGLNPELIRKEDFGRLAEFDALLIRATTGVNHHTYRFARKAAAEGLVAIDDPESILKCGNKVFLAELLERHRIPTPKTVIVHRGSRRDLLRELALPCILKQPDSSFSRGVVKVEREEELKAAMARLFEKSELIIAQEFMPTPFDWRIGVFDRQPLFACRYYMARRHWQIFRRDPLGGKTEEGRFETVPVESLPAAVLRTALKAANLIGDGLYGVDLKEVGDKVYVIEINDNPNIDAGVEDKVLRDELYRRLMRGILRRVEMRKGVFAS